MTAIGISFSMLLFFEQLHLGQHEMMANSGMRLSAGNIVIQGKGFNQNRELSSRVRNPDKHIEVLKKNFNSLHIIKRIFTSGNLTSPDGNIVVDTINGTEHAQEGKISDLKPKLIAGKWLSGNAGEIVIGAVAAKLLKVEIDSKVQLSMPDLGGNVVRTALRVRGIFKTGSTDTDRGYALVNIDEAAKLLNLGNAVSQIAIFTDLEKSTQVTHQIRKLIDDPSLEIMDWKDALPTLSQFMLVDKISMYVFLIIIFIIVAAGVLNSVLMSVMERTREFGVLKSIGMKPTSILNLIIIESALVGLLSIVFGFIVGQTISYIVYRYGIDPASLFGGESVEVAGVSMTEKIRTKITLWSVVWTSASVLLLTIISAIPPALRAARIIPVKAVREL